MSTNENKFLIRSKIWIEDAEGNVVFGDGRYRILTMVDQTKSLQGAAKELKMSYRALWGRIKASEERIGQPLVAREGKGSCLTPFARQLMDQFRKIKNNVLHESDSFYENLMAEHLEQ